MNQELLTKAPTNPEEIGVSLELAAKMVKNYHDKMGGEETHVITMRKDEIEKILSQPGCVGISFSEAIDQDGKKTWVYGGVNAKGRPIIEIVAIDQQGKLNIEKGIFGVTKPGVIKSGLGSGQIHSWFES